MSYTRTAIERFWNAAQMVSAHTAALAVAAATLCSPCAAQTDDDNVRDIQWWHAAVAVSGVFGLMTLDKAVADFAQDHRADDVAGVVRRFGETELYVATSLGVLAAGFILEDDRVTRAGARMATSVGITWALFNVSKFSLGRERPRATTSPTDFDPFTGPGKSLPSGHTAMAFALATTLADEIDNLWATVGLYSLATATGWSRINDNAHWLSDIALGAVLGITTAKFVNGRWRVFGLQVPSFLQDPSGRSGVGWNISF